MTLKATPVLVGIVIGSTVTLAISHVIRLRKTNRPSKKKQEQSSTMPAALREEQLSRHTLYFGKDGMDSLKNARVVVVGLGGVGSHAAHMLARSGVEHLRLIDFDQVTLSSLNRHACATLKDVGTPKATCLADFLHQICPSLLLEPLVEMYTPENGTTLLEGYDWDLVIDAIDDVPTKAALLAHCLSSNIRVISCMGAGGKSDVTRLHISDLKTASRDPLASKLRQSLKKLNVSDEDLGDVNQCAVVYSSEKTVMKLADFTEEQRAEGVHQYGAVDGMRIRVLPVLGTMPAIMGMACASLAICELGKKPFSPIASERVGRSVRHRLLQKLKRREKQISDDILKNADVLTPNPQEGRVVNGTWIGPIQIDDSDVEYLLEVWRCRCAVTGDRLGTVLEFVRWDLSKPSACPNLVLMGSSALHKFDAHGNTATDKSFIPNHVQQEIEARLKSCRQDAYAY